MPVYNFETPVNYEHFTKKINLEKMKEKKKAKHGTLQLIQKPARVKS